MLRVALLLILAAGTARSDPVPAAGRIEYAASEGTCSAVLIAPDLILTAAHCVGPGDGGRSFRPGDGTDTHAYALSTWAQHPYYDPHQARPNWKVRFDMGIARLAEPVPDWVARPLPLGTEAVEGETLHILSWRRIDGPLPRQRACRVISGLSGVVTLSCPVQGGESGAPVLRRGPEGLELVAIVSSRSSLGSQPIALASDVKLRLPPLIAEID